MKLGPLREASPPTPKLVRAPHRLWQALTELVFIKPQTLLFIGPTLCPELSPHDW